jgi:predicted amidohydrolase YtcJ
MPVEAPMTCCSNSIWKHLGAHGALDPDAILGDRATTQPAPPEPAPESLRVTIFSNGTFLLAEPRIENEQVTAVAIRADSIIDVGDVDRIKKTYPLAAQVDLGGTTLAPGFVEPHVHIIAAVENVYSTSLAYSPKIQCFDDVCNTIASTIACASPGAWFFFVLFDPSLLGPQPFSQLEFTQFDQIPGSSTVNIFVENASGHIAYANSLAFQTAGVTVGTNPGDGGWYGTTDGQLNGVMFEPPSFAPFLKFVPQKEVQAGALKFMLGFLSQCQQAGITTVADPAVGIGGSLASELEIYAYLASTLSGAQTDVVGSIDLTSLYAPSGDTPPPPPPSKLTPPSAPGQNGSYDSLIIPAVKIWADGSTQGYTGYLTQPYIGTVTPSGLSNVGEADWDVSDMANLLQQAQADNWSVLVHCNGDAGLALALGCLGTAYGAGAGFHNRIEHCTVTTTEQYATMKALNLSQTYLTNHIHIWGDTFNVNILGNERASRLDAVTDGIAQGMLYSFHCDYATSNPAPLQYMQTAVTRQTSSGVVLGAQYAITAAQALLGVTLYPAQQLGIDGLVGSIVTNKRANLVNLKYDPTTCPSDQIAGTPIIATYLRGVAIPIS